MAPVDPPVALDQLDLSATELEIHTKLVEMFAHQVVMVMARRLLYTCVWLARCSALRHLNHRLTHRPPAHLDAAWHLQELGLQRPALRFIGKFSQIVGCCQLQVPGWAFCQLVRMHFILLSLTGIIDKIS